MCARVRVCMLRRDSLNCTNLPCVLLLLQLQHYQTTRMAASSLVCAQADAGYMWPVLHYLMQCQQLPMYVGALSPHMHTEAVPRMQHCGHTHTNMCSLIHACAGVVLRM
jgi:hypothetical protein